MYYNLGDHADSFNITVSRFCLKFDPATANKYLLNDRLFIILKRLHGILLLVSLI